MTPLPDEIVEVLAALKPEHAAALYEPRTVVALAAEVQALRVIASNLHPCRCLRAASDHGVDPTAHCPCPCHQRIEEALRQWNPDRLPHHPDLLEAPNE